MSVRFWESPQEKAARKKKANDADTARQEMWRQEARQRSDREEQRLKEEKEYWDAERQKMYTMEHGERLQIDKLTYISRVAGGWIYTHLQQVPTEEPTDMPRHLRSGPEFTYKPYGTTFVPYIEQSDETFYTLKNKDTKEQE